MVSLRLFPTTDSGWLSHLETALHPSGWWYGADIPDVIEARLDRFLKHDVRVAGGCKQGAKKAGFPGQGRKLTLTAVRTDIGLPFSNTGSNFQLSTAFMAARTK